MASYGIGVTVAVVAGLFLLACVAPVGADKDDADDERFKSNDGDYECFYNVGQIGDLRYLGSMYCKYGCCGRTDAQRCCTEEEKEKKAHRLSGTMIVLASTFAGIIAIVVTAVVIYCCCKHKADKTKSKYTQDAGRTNPDGNLFNVMEMGPSNGRPSAPPSGTVYPRQEDAGNQQGHESNSQTAPPVSPPPYQP